MPSFWSAPDPSSPEQQVTIDLLIDRRLDLFCAYAICSDV
jgi:hypothetical protein